MFQERKTQEKENHAQALLSAVSNFEDFSTSFKWKGCRFDIAFNVSSPTAELSVQIVKSNHPIKLCWTIDKPIAESASNSIRTSLSETVNKSGFTFVESLRSALEPYLKAVQVEVGALVIYEILDLIQTVPPQYLREPIQTARHDVDATVEHWADNMMAFKLQLPAAIRLFYELDFANVIETSLVARGPDALGGQSNLDLEVLKAIVEGLGPKCESNLMCTGILKLLGRHLPQLNTEEMRDLALHSVRALVVDSGSDTRPFEAQSIIFDPISKWQTKFKVPKILGLDTSLSLFDFCSPCSLDLGSMMVREGCSEEVYANLDKFPADCREQILDELAANGRLMLSECKVGEDIHSRVKCDALARKLIAENQLQTFVNALHNFREVSFDIAKELIKNGKISDVYDHLSNFKFSKTEKAFVLRAALTAEKFGLVLSNIGNFSEEILEDFNAEYHLADYRSEIGIGSDAIYSEYLRLRKAQDLTGCARLIEDISQMMESSISSERQGRAMTNHRFYPDVIKYVYGDMEIDEFESCNAALDRSDDLELFEVEPVYKLRLRDAATVSLRAGAREEDSTIRRIEKLIAKGSKSAETANYDSGRLKTELVESINTILPSELRDEAASLDSLFSKAVDLAMTRRITANDFRQVLIKTYFSTSPEVRDYINETTDRSKAASNPRYTYLLELREFFTYKVVDSAIKILDRADYNGLPPFELRKYISSLFQEELKLIDIELKKYVLGGDESRRLREIEAYFTKNRTSAFMRHAAGTCVEQDNPKSKDDAESECQWNLENYLQLVFKDTDTRRCAGGVLLHYYEDQGKTILTASLNPSSTFLYKVDERLLFDRIMQTIEAIAVKNDIDLILFSKDRNILTNRTGGEFEKAIEARIREVNSDFELSESQDFSFDPYHDHQEFYVAWVNPGRE